MMEPGETHSTKKEVQPASFRVLFISPEAMRDAIAELGGCGPAPHFKLAQLLDFELFAAFRDFHFSFEGNASKLEQESLFTNCLRHLAEKCLESPIPNRLFQVHSSGVRKAKDCLRESFRRNVSLDELASVAGVSKFHFARIFKREVGLAPHDFQIQLRLSAARDLLRKEFSIARVAADVGFSDQSHFTRHFRESLGVTPREYAECVRPISVFFPRSSSVNRMAMARRLRAPQKLSNNVLNRRRPG